MNKLTRLWKSYSLYLKIQHTLNTIQKDTQILRTIRLLMIESEKECAYLESDDGLKLKETNPKEYNRRYNQLVHIQTNISHTLHDLEKKSEKRKKKSKKKG